MLPAAGPNALSLSRLLLTPFMAWALLGGHALLALLLFTLAVASDLADGPWARRRGTTSTFGTALDHGADAVFVTGTTAALAALGHVTPLLPALIALAFVQYACDQRLLSTAGIRPSRLGRWNGIGYYILGGAGAVVVGYCPRLCADALAVCAWLLVVTTLVSMAGRLRHAVLARRR